jgi:hypothetical protein
MYDVRCSMLDVQCMVCNAGCAMLDDDDLFTFSHFHIFTLAH